jgi:hypothetical protein
MREFKMLSRVELEKMPKHRIKAYRQTVYKQINRNVVKYVCCEICKERYRPDEIIDKQKHEELHAYLDVVNTIFESKG